MEFGGVPAAKDGPLGGDQEQAHSDRPAWCVLAVLRDTVTHVCLFGTGFYSSPALTGFGPVFRRITALAGSWEEVVAEIECKTDPELSPRWVPSAHSTVDQHLTYDAVRTTSSIP